MPKTSALGHFIAQPKSLRFKVVASIGGVFLVLFLTQFIIARFLLLRNYNALEQEQTKLNVERLRNTLAERLAKLDSATVDYAQWDDIYAFTQTRDQQFVTTSLSDVVFSNLSINLICILNTQGQVLFKRQYDLVAQRRIPFPIDVEQLLLPSSKLRSAFMNHPQLDSKVMGLLSTKAGPMMVVARPILDSDRKGPVRGTLVMGRYFDRAELQNLAETTRQQLQVYPFRDPHLPPDVRAMKENLQKTLLTVKSLSEKTIAGYLLVPDVQGQPLLIMRSAAERRIYAQGQMALVYYFGSTFVIGTLLCGFSLLLLERLILSRLSHLRQEVTAIGSSGSLAARVTLPPGHDELTEFVTVLNNTLAHLAQVQHALQVSEERYMLATQGANDGIWDWQINMPHLYLSPRGQAILGQTYAADRATVSEWYASVHPDDRDAFQRAIADHLQQKTRHLEHEYRIRYADDSYIWVLCRGLALLDGNQQPYRMAGSLTDITARKLAEVTLARQTAELQRSNQELEQFAYVASHDLQEPLRKIEAFSDRLRAKYGEILGEQGADYLQRMQNAAQRMRTLIQDLLAFSRVGTQGQSFCATDLTAIVQEVLADLEIPIRETNAQIEVAALPTLEADPMQMRQLFQNLISNALKFQPPHHVPQVNIGWEPASLAEEPITDIEPQAIRLAVTDNGIGFDTKYLDRIFKVFQRLHSRNDYAGTGIGLAICAKIVERHGGHISADSQPNHGATFFVTLPRLHSQIGDS